MSRTPKLRRLYGFSNWISGDLPELNFPSLEYLLLEDNRLEGFGALSKWKMKSLENIILSNNTISGSLPAFSLPGLKHLDLCQNRISDISHIGECQLPRLE
jgi:Leucine-rich repeat (LRR) protein